MIEVHHLNNSRSQRVLWLLEEMGLPYALIPYQRHPETMLAPDELMAIHPLGKAPVIRDGGVVLAESGAIIEYLTGKYGAGQWVPAADTNDYADYLYWLHYAEGSLMAPVLLFFYSMRLGHVMAPEMEARIERQLNNHFAMIAERVTVAPFLGGARFGSADIMISFPLEMANGLGILDQFPAITRYIEALRGRPAYMKALECESSYNFSELIGK